jgi:hypothetical protein
MKRNLYPLLLAPFLLALPSVGCTADYAVDATSILGFAKRDVIGADKQTLMPATQFLGLDVDKLADGNLSLHLYGWGRVDLADDSYNTSKTAGNLTYGYLQYRFKQANTTVRAGRFFIHEGIINEQVDGASARADLPLGFGLSAFGGAPVHGKNLVGENSDGKGDGIFGGRVNYRYKGMLEAGLSAIYESSAPDLIFSEVGNHRLVGGDIWFSPHRMIEIIGHSSYNTPLGRIAEHSYLLNFKPLPGLVVSGTYNEQNDRSYLYSSALFTTAKLDPSAMSSTAGTSVSYAFGKNIELSADYKHYRREVGSADRFGADARFSYLENSLRSGLSYHYLDAGAAFAIGTNPTGSFHEFRAYTLHDTKTYFASIDGIGYFFKDKIYDKKNALEANASLGYHLTPALAMSGDISFGKNPDFTSETKGLIRLTYNMTSDAKGGKK